MRKGKKGKKHHEEEADEKETKKGKKGKKGKKESSSKLPSAVTGILEASKAESYGSVRNFKNKKALVFIGGKPIAVIKKDSVELRYKKGPKALGLKSSNWEDLGGGKFEFKGKSSAVGKSLRIAFKKLAK